MTAGDVLLTYGPQALLGLLGIFIANLLQSMRSSLDGLRSEISSLRAEDRKLHERIDEKTGEIHSRLQYVEQNFVTRPEIAAGQRDMRQDIQSMENKILDQLRLIQQDIALLHRVKLDKSDFTSSSQSGGGLL